MTDHAIVVADADGTITCWSPGAEVLFGHSAAAAVGQNLDIIMPEVLRAPLDWPTRSNEVPDFVVLDHGEQLFVEKK